MKSRTHFQQRAYAPINLCVSARGLGDAGKDFKECALPSSIVTNDSDNLAGLDFERDVV